MIRITAHYHWHDGAHFDHEHYLNRHTPMAQQVLSAHGLLRLECDRFLSEQAPRAGDLIAATHVYFPDLASAQAAIAAAAPMLLADVPNYTSITPVLRLSEVRVFV